MWHLGGALFRKVINNHVKYFDKHIYFYVLFAFDQSLGDYDFTLVNHVCRLRRYTTSQRSQVALRKIRV